MKTSDDLYQSQTFSPLVTTYPLPFSFVQALKKIKRKEINAYRVIEKVDTPNNLVRSITQGVVKPHIDQLS